MQSGAHLDRPPGCRFWLWHYADLPFTAKCAARTKVDAILMPGALHIQEPVIQPRLGRAFEARNGALKDGLAAQGPGREFARIGAVPIFVRLAPPASRMVRFRASVEPGRIVAD